MSESSLISEWIFAALAARGDRASRKAWLARQVVEIEAHEERTGADMSRIKLLLLLHLSAVIENEKQTQEEPTLCATPTN